VMKVYGPVVIVSRAGLHESWWIVSCGGGTSMKRREQRSEDGVLEHKQRKQLSWL